VLAGLFGDPPETETAQPSLTTLDQREPATTLGDPEQPQATEPPATARQSDMNQPKRDGQFEFVVSKIECGRRTVGGSGLEKRAQGQYCFVSVRVSNIGREARTFDSTSQYLYDSGGRRFETDESTLYVEDSGNAFLEEINPGNGVDGTLVYDVPRSGFTPGKLELHDSAFSGGVEVNL
jgi:hypothetical protein